MMLKLCFVATPWPKTVVNKARYYVLQPTAFLEGDWLIETAVRIESESQFLVITFTPRNVSDSRGHVVSESTKWVKSSVMGFPMIPFGLLVSYFI